MTINFSASFPNLTDIAQKETSKKDGRYNCIAWAFEDNQRVWWPNLKRAFWPQNCAGQTALDAFESWFAADGWVATANRDVEQNFKKVALFCKNGHPTHAARQLCNGNWTSKLGPSIDLWHGINDLNGPEYGYVHKVFKKPKP